MPNEKILSYCKEYDNMEYDCVILKGQRHGNVTVEKAGVTDGEPYWLHPQTMDKRDAMEYVMQFANDPSYIVTEGSFADFFGV